MKKVLSLLTLLVVGQFGGEALAADRVVVVPLASARSTSCDGPDEVLSQGQCWKDRNLGAVRVAQSMDDSLAFGDLYQWGRLGDGHQNRTIPAGGPGISDVISGTDVPGHSDFIYTSGVPYDWRNPANGNLWQGIGGVNNPCPQGFRIPTEAEFERERASWTSNDTAGAFNSPLKLPTAGYRHYASNWIYNTFWGYYWTSTVDGTMSRYLFITHSGAVSPTEITSVYRGQGCSIRCIKE